MNTKSARLKTLEYLKANKKHIVKAWNEMLVTYAPFQEKKRFSIIQGEQEKGIDFLSVLLEIDTTNYNNLYKKIDTIVNRIHSPYYSVTDFTSEVYCLETAICQILRVQDFLSGHLWEVISLIRKDIFNLTSMIIQKSVSVYEFVVENGKRPFCYFEYSGKIVYSNKAMLSLMGVKVLDPEKKVTDFFVKENKKRIQEMLKNLDGSKHLCENMDFKDCKGNIISVDGEIAPVVLGGNAVGGYASLLNLSKVLEGQKKVYDNSPVGIIKVNLKNQFTYANPVALEMFGVKHLAGGSIEKFVKKEDWKKVKQHLKARFENGLADEYDVEASMLGKRPKTMPIRISGIPEMNLKGDIIGSLAIIHNMEIEKASAAIYETVETVENFTTFFEAIGTIVNRLVPFSEMIISNFSSDRKHIKSMNWRPDKGRGMLGRQGVWWAVPKYLEDWLFDSKNYYVEDMETFFSHQSRSSLKNNPEIQTFLKKKLLSMVRCTVIREKKIIASLSFFRRKKNAFSSKEIETIRKLPLHKAILISRYEAEKATLEFRLDLMNRVLDVCHDLDQVGQTIVESLVVHYQWLNASFFFVDKANDTFRLKGQKALNDIEKYLLPEDYTQPLKAGILGYVYRHKRNVNIANINTDKKFQKYYVRGHKATKSELCIPIVVEGKAFWLLNIEDARENAFCRDDIDSLNQIIREVSEILKRAHAYYIHTVTLNSTSDAVITTDFQGKINTANPAAEKLLQLEFNDLKGKSFRKYFKDKKLFDHIRAERHIVSGKEAYISGALKKENCVLLSSSPLPVESGGRVYIAKDLSLIKQVRRLEYLNQMTYEVALQTKTPLSLMFSWLERLEKSNAKDRSELVQKLVNQLRKIELTTDRLALFEEGKGLIPYNELVLDFKEVIQFLKKDFPESDIRKINFKDDNTPFFRGDIFQIKFCMETILSYLLRYLPRKRNIDFITTHTNNWVQCRINGFLPIPGADSMSEEKEAVRQTLKDIALGEPIIHNFICKNHKGKYHRSKSQPGQFCIDLPLRGNT